MFSRSSSKEGEAALPIGRVTGHRGRFGQITIRVASGEPGRWMRLTAVEIGEIEAGPGGRTTFEVLEARGYRDRLVLTLRGLTDAGAAAALKGSWVYAPAEQVPELPAGTYYVERLVGMRVENGTGADLGRVEGVTEIPGGVDLLQVRHPGGAELLVPLSRTIVRGVDEDRRLIRIEPPEGLIHIGQAEGTSR